MDTMLSFDVAVIVVGLRGDDVRGRDVGANDEIIGADDTAATNDSIRRLISSSSSSSSSERGTSDCV
jgi:hypothetical protein